MEVQVGDDSRKVRRDEDTTPNGHYGTDRIGIGPIRAPFRRRDAHSGSLLVQGAVRAARADGEA